MKELCNGSARVWEKLPKTHELHGRIWSNERPAGIKRKRLTCPKCKRRLMSSVKLYHDGDEVIHDIPPHKPKKWWKKNNVR